MLSTKVRKRDGNLAKFEREKVKKSITSAGGSPAEAESIASEIEKWIQKTSINGTVQSSSIRKKVLELLRPQNPKAALDFEQYKK